MGWIGGEYIEGADCEDAPCCGCCGPEAVDEGFFYDDAWFEN
jgi:hypothetical protein